MYYFPSFWICLVRRCCRSMCSWRPLVIEHRPQGHDWRGHRPACPLRRTATPWFRQRLHRFRCLEEGRPPFVGARRGATGDRGRLLQYEWSCSCWVRGGRGGSAGFRGPSSSELALFRGSSSLPEKGELWFKGRFARREPDLTWSSFLWVVFFFFQ